MVFFVFVLKQHQAGDTESVVSHRLAVPRTEDSNLQEDMAHEQVNGKVVKSNSDAHLNTSSGMWLMWCSFKSYRAAYQVIHSEVDYRLCQEGPKTAVDAGIIVGF